MKARERLVTRPLFLLGMPRSGTTWLSQIFESSPDFIVRLSPNYSRPLKNVLDLGSSREEWVSSFSYALHTDDEFMTQDFRRANGELGRFPPRSVGNGRAAGHQGHALSRPLPALHGAVQRSPGHLSGAASRRHAEQLVAFQGVSCTGEVRRRVEGRGLPQGRGTRGILGLRRLARPDHALFGARKAGARALPGSADTKTWCAIG